jgi:hypothetical protein
MMLREAALSGRGAAYVVPGAAYASCKGAAYASCKGAAYASTTVTFFQNAT